MLVFLIAPLLIIFAIIATVSLVMDRHSYNETDFLLWLLVIWLIQPVGGIVYFIVKN